MSEVEALARDLAELPAERKVIICLSLRGLTLGDFEALAFHVRELNPGLRLEWMPEPAARRL